MISLFTPPPSRGPYDHWWMRWTTWQAAPAVGVFLLPVILIFLLAGGALPYEYQFRLIPYLSSSSFRQATHTRWRGTRWAAVFTELLEYSLTNVLVFALLAINVFCWYAAYLFIRFRAWP